MHLPINLKPQGWNLHKLKNKIVINIEGYTNCSIITIGLFEMFLKKWKSMSTANSSQGAQSALLPLFDKKKM